MNLDTATTLLECYLKIEHECKELSFKHASALKVLIINALRGSKIKQSEILRYYDNPKAYPHIIKMFRKD